VAIINEESFKSLNNAYLKDGGKLKLLMKLYTEKEMQAVDKEAIEAGIPSIVLMENAGRAVADGLRQRWPTAQRVVILCGKGNNGGDGYVAARHLKESSLDVTILELDGKLVGASKDTQSARASAVAHGISLTDLAIFLSEPLPPSDVFVDALLGSGLSRPLEGQLADIVTRINKTEQPVLSVDVPTGVGADQARPLGVHVRATRTIQLAGAKLASALFPARDAFGEVSTAPIGIPNNLLIRHSNTNLVTRQYIQDHAPERLRGGHKYSAGTVLVIGGSAQYTGAAELAARAALRAGAGIVSVLSEDHRSAIWPDIIRYNRKAGTVLAKQVASINNARSQARVIGPGLDSELANQVPGVLALDKTPTVLDAGALEPGPELSEATREHGACVLTPHLGEASRLLSSDVSVIADDPVEAASVMAKKYSAVVVLKGATTVIASPKGDLAVSPFGHPGMATAGTGDVLAGLLGAWLSTATDPFVRSCAAVGIHGLTGEITGNEKGVGMIASDLVEYLPTSLQRLHMMGFAR
jgi:hydroxyethylthiazole kinase-like uncharacterized protein yjeF